MELEREYGVTFYVDVMPRVMTPAEYKEYILDLYVCGVERFSFWDAVTRASRRVEWSMISRLGHKDELPSFTDGSDVLWHRERVLSAGGLSFARYFPNWGG